MIKHKTIGEIHPNSCKQKYTMKKFKFLVPIITLISASYIFYLALENNSNITDQQSNALVICSIFLFVLFTANVIKIVKSEFTKWLLRARKLNVNHYKNQFCNIFLLLAFLLIKNRNEFFIYLQRLFPKIIISYNNSETKFFEYNTKTFRRDTKCSDWLD